MSTFWLLLLLEILFLAIYPGDDLVGSLKAADSSNSCSSYTISLPDSSQVVSTPYRNISVCGACNTPLPHLLLQLPLPSQKAIEDAQVLHARLYVCHIHARRGSMVQFHGGSTLLFEF